MLSWPRLDPYTKRPDGCTTTSAVEFATVVPGGSVEMDCRCTSVATAGFQAKTPMLFVSSLMT